MPLFPRPGWNILTGTLLLSLFAHALALVALSLRRPPEAPRMRVVAEVQVVDHLLVPKPPAAQRPPKVLLPPPPRLVDQPGHEGTRPGVGGDPAPAPVSLKMELPRTAARRSDPKSSIHRDRSRAGEPEGRPFGDPDGVPGGTGTGGSGPGGTGGSGEGGVPRPETPPALGSHEEILRKGKILCVGCHIPGIGSEKDALGQTRPINIEFLSQDSGWNIKGGSKNQKEPGAVEVEFRYVVAPDGRIEHLTIVRSSSDPREAEALKHFATMHQFTPPGKTVSVTCSYLFVPLRP